MGSDTDPNLCYLMVMMRFTRQFFHPPPIQSHRLTIRGMGIRESMPPCLVDRPEGTGDCLLMLFFDPVTVRYSDRVHQLPGNTMMFWAADVGHYYGNEASEWRHSWLHCDGSSVGELLSAANLRWNQAITLTDPSRVDHYLEEIYREVTGYAAPVEQIVANTLQSMLLDVQRQVSGGQGAIPALFLDLRCYLSANIAEPISLADMAQRVNLSVSHFSSEFKRFFGISPVEYAIQMRLNYAASLLRDGNLNVTQVAAAAGYNDAFHFSKQFRVRFDCTPSEMLRSSRAPTR